MKSEKKFDPGKLHKLNNPQRLKDIPVEHILEQAELEQKEVFVEIGAGTAFFSIAFLEQAAPTTLYACDISAPMLDWVRENVVPRYPAIYPVRNEEVTIPLGDAIADLVFMIHLHHELDNPQRILEEAYRLLRKGGKVLVIDWKKEEMTEGPPVHIRCQPQEVERQMKRANFQQIRHSSELAKHFFVIAQK